MIKERIENILKEIDLRANLVVAVKYANDEQMKEVINSGVNLGFNTLQQFEKVHDNFDLSNTKTHFIGQIQSNKIAKIVKLQPYLIQSVSSYGVAEKISSVCSELNIKQKILLQVNSDSEKIEGFQIEGLNDEILKIKSLQNIEICGLMTIPPEIEKVGETQLREIYRKMRLEYFKLHKNLGLNFEFLSMGMSNDYLIAIEEGANMVRIGRKFFK